MTTMQNNMSTVLPIFFDVIMTSDVIDIYVQCESSNLC